VHCSVLDQVDQCLCKPLRVHANTRARRRGRKAQTAVEQRCSLRRDLVEEALERDLFEVQVRGVIRPNERGHVVDDPPHPAELVDEDVDRFGQLLRRRVRAQHLEVAAADRDRRLQLV
jgi:hypothetical protein